MDVLLWWMVGGVCGLWIVLKTWQDSPLLAVGIFFFFPLAIVSLLKNWGTDNDIKIPFGLAVLCAFMAYRSAETFMQESLSDPALAWTPEQIEEIRREDPALAAQIEDQQMQALLDQHVVFESDPNGPPGASVEIDFGPQARRRMGMQAEPESSSQGEVAGAEASIASAPEPEGPPLGLAAAERRKQMQAAAEVEFQRGAVVLGRSQAQLVLPQSFRFVAANQLAALSELRDMPLDEEVIGWAVHEQVDLSKESAWWVVIRHIPGGHLNVANDAQSFETSVRGINEAEAGPQLGEGLYAPTWQPETAVATWGLAPDELTVGDVRGQFALKALRQGAVLFIAGGTGPHEQELGLRAVRLLATRTEAANDWSYADFEPGLDPQAERNLAQWIALRPAQAGAGKG